jgi:hypothetical protein
MPKTIDITGRTFGRLTVIGNGGRDRWGKRLWHCRCSCGGETLATARNLKIGHTKSCGCWRRDSAVNVKTIHGQSYTRLHGIWSGMLQRCVNPNVKAFSRYGGRGIRVCEDWHSFVKFRDWAVANGYQDDLAIDRIDNDGNYEPTNCRWETYAAQSRNQPQNRAVIRSDGRRFDYVTDAARASGTTTSQIASAIKRGGTSGGFGWCYDEQRREHSGSASRPPGRDST